MKDNKKNDIELDNLLFAIINDLSYENQILRKKLKNQKLNKKEEFFDTFIISPSTILRIITKDKEN